MDYRCDAGHEITTPEPKRVDRCLAATCLSPRLKAYGDGSTAENGRLKAIYEKQDREKARAGQLDL